MTDAWDKPRSHGTHLTDEEIAFVREGYDAKRKTESVAEDLQCATRTVSEWYKRFSLGWAPQPAVAKPARDLEAKYTAPVQKREFRKPNVMPGIPLHKLVARRA